MNIRSISKWIYIFIVVFAAACAPLPAPPAPNATATSNANDSATQTAFIPTQIFPTPSFTLSPEPAPSQETATPVGSPTTSTQFIAYVQDGQLLVTDITNGVKGGTTQYTTAGNGDQVNDLVWSPSGEFVAFVAPVNGDMHIFYIYALGESSPTDLGPGSAPAWSPDSQSIVYVSGTYPDNNIWITTIDNPAPRQLTSEKNYAWGRPAFTPDGQSLVVVGADRDFMGAQGNTRFTLESLALDGSGNRTPLPGATLVDGARLPYDLRFSPDGTKLAYSTSFHLSACAAPGAYYVSNADGSNLQELISPSLKGAIDPNQEHYHVGLSYTWNTTSDAIIALGNVVDCAANSPTIGQAIAGPQMSVIGLDGSERLVIPGYFYGISIDRTGTLIAAAHYKDIHDQNPNVEIYSAQTGQLILTTGPGRDPQFQP